MPRIYSVKMGDREVLKEATIAYSEELALFAHPVQEVGVQRFNYVSHYPNNDYTQQNILEFMISGAGSRYIDLKRSRLSLTCKILKADGTALPSRKNKDGETDANSLLAPVNNFFSSIWERVDIQLQEKCVTSADTNYPYLAYLKNLLFTSKTSKGSYLQSQLYYHDDAKGIASYNPSEDANKGLKTRASFIEESKPFDMEGPLACDVCELQRFLPQGIAIRIKFYPSKPDFFLMSPIAGNPEFALKITRAVLKLCTVEVSPEVLLSHAEIMTKQMGFFPYTQTILKQFAISKGAYFYELSDPFLSIIPSSLTLGVLTEKSRNGDLTSNPFNFVHANLSYIQLTVDGVEVGCYEPSYSANPENGLYTASFNSLHTLDNIEDLGISRLDYCQGYTLYNFNIDPSSSVMHDSDLMPLKRKGHLRVILKFSQQLEEPMTLMTMARFPAALKLDRSRVVYTT